MTANTTQTLTRPERKAPERKAPERKAPERKAPERQAARPPVIAGTRPSRDSSAGDVVLAYLRTQAHTLKTLEPAVRADEFDSVHQMRVATRRLRAVLRTFGQVIPRTDSEHLAGELQWLGRELGAARDSEVLAGHLRDSLRPTPPELLIGPVQARVQGHFAPLRAAARGALMKALDSARYARLLAELDRVAAGPARGPLAGAPAREVLPAAVRRAYRQAKRRMRTARHTPDGPARDAALHQVRKSARRTRYAAEAATPAIGKRARKFAKQMKHVQSVLGDHHDAVLARQAARDLGIGAHLAGENAFTYGLLHERELHHAERLQTRASKVWRHASRPKHRSWMN
jgi:CHAD domain-containing protein